MPPRFAPIRGARRLLRLGGQLTYAGVKITGWVERQAMSALRARLDIAEPLALTAARAPTSSRATNLESMQNKMNTLLDRALSQSSTTSRHLLFHQILDQIVPDEARIIGALSDGSESALIHVYARTRAGLVGEVVLENMSLIGKTANLGLPQLTPTYVSHLLSLGLVETSPEDSSLKDDYEILAADTAVLRAIKKASRGPIPARIDRLTLRLSGLGRELWAATSVEGT